MSEEDFKIDLLKELEDPGSQSHLYLGSAMGSAFSYLKKKGYVSERGKVTTKGKRFLENDRRRQD